MKTRSDVLVDAAWLDAHLHDPAVRVVEVDVSRRAHDEWHIDGAVLWDVYRDLKDADYRLVDRDRLQDLLERSGITPDSTSFSWAATIASLVRRPPGRYQ